MTRIETKENGVSVTLKGSAVQIFADLMNIHESVIKALADCGDAGVDIAMHYKEFLEDEDMWTTLVHDILHGQIAQSADEETEDAE